MNIIEAGKKVAGRVTVDLPLKWEAVIARVAEVVGVDTTELKIARVESEVGLSGYEESEGILYLSTISKRSIAEHLIIHGLIEDGELTINEDGGYDWHGRQYEKPCGLKEHMNLPWKEEAFRKAYDVYGLGRWFKSSSKAWKEHKVRSLASGLDQKMSWAGLVHLTRAKGKTYQVLLPWQIAMVHLMAMAMRVDLKEVMFLSDHTPGENPQVFMYNGRIVLQLVPLAGPCSIRHELEHVRQLQDGKLELSETERVAIWEGVRHKLPEDMYSVANLTSYWDYPWEVEARKAAHKFHWRGMIGQSFRRADYAILNGHVKNALALEVIKEHRNGKS